MQINKIRPIIYLSGPMTNYGDIKENVRIAQEYAMKLRSLGFAVICPHSNGNPIDRPSELTWELWMEEDYSHVLVSHGIFMLPNWEKSKGAQVEHEWAKELGIPIFYHEHEYICIVDYFYGEKTVWQRCPNQVHGFLKTVGKLFRVHLSKNEDYSPHNILGTGNVGLATRLWDKCCRFMNLVGFDISTGEYSTPKEAKNEPLEDTILDNANYSIIWMLYRLGCWGR